MAPIPERALVAPCPASDTVRLANHVWLRPWETCATRQRKIAIISALCATACAGATLANDAVRSSLKAIPARGIGRASAGEASRLIDPFLQLHTEDSVNVVWVTEFEGAKHVLVYGEGFDQLAAGSARSLAALSEGASTPKLRVVSADTFQFSSLREVQSSRVPGRRYDSEQARPLWRHEAFAAGLTTVQRVPYAVISVREDGSVAVSDVFSLAPKLAPWIQENYAATDDPHGLAPIVPNVSLLIDANGNAMPSEAGNDYTVFSILDTAKA